MSLGTDPSTDLRGTGFLGLLQILYLMTSHSNLGQKIYKLSLHETQVRKKNTRF